MVGIRRENSRPGDPNFIKNTKELPSIEAWFAQKEKFRAVGHGFPMGMPQMQDCSPELERLFQETLKPKITSILGKFSINYSSIRLDDWRSKGTGEVQHTILVSSNDTNTTKWKTAAEEILRVFRHELPLDFTGDAQVEVQNKQLMNTDVSRAVPNEPALIKCLEGTKEGITETVMESLNGCWSSIGYHTRVPLGSSPDIRGRVTVMVYCRFGSRGDFKTAEDRILKVLDKSPMDIHVEIAPGEVFLARNGEGPRFLADIPASPINGASISVRGNNTEPGSLGGWVWLHIPRRDMRVRCVLTCYHVVRSPNETIAAHTDVHGVVPDDRRGHIVAEYPAACDGQHTLDILTSLPKNKANSLEVRSQYRDLYNRMVNPAIGKVTLASGNRISDNSRMDWALITSPSTFRPNKLPPSPSKQDTFSLSLCGAFAMNPDSWVMSFGDVELGDWVSKYGRTSGTTYGKINHLRREVRWPSGERTYEMEVISPNGEFSRPGDSGSMVVNSRGEFVGLVLATDSSTPFGVTYITPISHILRDINRMTGGGFLTLRPDDYGWFTSV
ncbi:hypothetical protein H112_05996 [Trichophyton rubrum D6]|uniref:Peptidase S7 domain-containing protein n=4 Tax=Trichophyton TaxID=5550 RepID=A0A178ERA0_TRIRU|nr:uncharacterized protein TERG_03703 [Trichophyton rubrum CBS 118892]EZF14825.1 hypothetical protein H100_06010 [Trichophyton rubrum MR850]EZF39942.1 hypothetical protein H102_05979 [Trichophyton rubrum CBS 100081]EZF50582.1 hypothetical protein H103_06004 [Trichophyton rubrum CBS 288.86]EZF61126.1 hypothetical protein H104_05992 [Trichophyton rubrum CBS 289.86]EZF71759.1 hypothetical protein H105_06019 [Trichophyton soudanense CBS 452.61]EZF82342.1 hypothetical protein H110_06000 [Trichophy